MSVEYGKSFEALATKDPGALTEVGIDVAAKEYGTNDAKSVSVSIMDKIFFFIAFSFNFIIFSSLREHTD